MGRGGRGCCNRDCCGLIAGYSVSDMKKLSMEDVSNVLYHNRISILVGVFMEVALVSLWLLASMVTAFVMYDGDAGQVSAFTHASFWYILAYWTSILGGAATGFSPVSHDASTRGKRTIYELNLTSMDSYLSFYAIMIGISFTAQAFHAGFTIAELSNRTSTLALQYMWLGGIFCAGLGLLCILYLWQLLRVLTYRNNLASAAAAGRIDLKISYDDEDNEKATDDTVTTTDVKRRLNSLLE